MTNKKIELIFSTTAGDLERDFSVNQPLKAIMVEVMRRLKLDPSQVDQFVITLDGNLLDGSMTLLELEISSGAILILERREVVKI